MFYMFYSTATYYSANAARFYRIGLHIYIRSLHFVLICFKNITNSRDAKGMFYAHESVATTGKNRT